MPQKKDVMKDRGPTEKVTVKKGKTVLQFGKPCVGGTETGVIEVTPESRRHLEKTGYLEGATRTAPKGYSDHDIEEAIEAGSTGKKPYHPGKKGR